MKGYSGCCSTAGWLLEYEKLGWWFLCTISCGRTKKVCVDRLRLHRTRSPAPDSPAGTKFCSAENKRIRMGWMTGPIFLQSGECDSSFSTYSAQITRLISFRFCPSSHANRTLRTTFKAGLGLWKPTCPVQARLIVRAWRANPWVVDEVWLKTIIPWIYLILYIYNK